MLLRRRPTATPLPLTITNLIIDYNILFNSPYPPGNQTQSDSAAAFFAEQMFNHTICTVRHLSTRFSIRLLLLARRHVLIDAPAFYIRFNEKAAVLSQQPQKHNIKQAELHPSTSNIEQLGCPSDQVRKLPSLLLANAHSVIKKIAASRPYSSVHGRV